VKHATEALARSLGLRLDERSLARLRTFEELLRTRAVPHGFVAQADAAELRERHIHDSLRAAPLILSGVAGDLGSGAGLPGIVVAIARPDIRVELIESQRRRLAFLELAVERLGLANAEPVGERIEGVRTQYDTVLARAFADAARSWRAAEARLEPNGRLVYFAGAGFDRAGTSIPGVAVELVPPPSQLASAGPLVIMSRQ